MINKPLVLMIVGPTATGKTDAGVYLAKRLDGEVISADSMQIYNGMDIGTAKPSAAEREGIVHHMMDIIEPEERYSVGRYQREATVCIDDILNRNKLPIVVGGTGLYIRSLTHPYSFARTEGGGDVRGALEQELDAMGAETMHARLAELDPISAARLHINDTRRVIRALEIVTLTGKPASVARQNDLGAQGKWRCVMMGMRVVREELYARIDARVDRMMSMGLLGEVEALLKRGVPRESTAMNGIGYKQLAEYLLGGHKGSLNDTVELIKQYSRNLAKRQVTWFNREDIFWCPKSVNCLLEYARDALDNYV